MTLDAALKAALEARLGRRIVRAERCSGGDINEAYRIDFFDGDPAFVKTNPRAPRDMFTSEARGLEWLREANTLRIPQVLTVTSADEGTQFLVLEFIQPGRPTRKFDEQLGQGLAALHRTHPQEFGFEQDNFIGSLPQQNAPRTTWADFYRSQRLEPQFQRAVDARQLSYALRRNFERLCERLPELVGPPEPPARLHGDLWGGNLHVDERGAPCLIDPAVYGGHREVDLAMMRLFGGFSESVFASYQDAYPLPTGAAERVALYQLYPLLVHVNLFGGSYVGSAERAIARYA